MLRKEKIKYCRDCGGIIDNKTKKCSICQRQFFKFSKQKLTFTILILIIFGLCVYGIYQHNIISINNNTISELSKEIENLNSSITSKEARINELTDICDEYEHQEEYYKEMEKFAKEECAIVYNNGTKYHGYNCLSSEVLDITCNLWDNDDSKYYTYQIFNISAAEAKGYIPCSYCH